MRFRILAALALLAISPLASAQQPIQSLDAANKSAMHDMSMMKMTGDTDQDFAMMMIRHHKGAIDMARIELAKGKDPEMKVLAQKIIDDQEREIAQMDRWLTKK